MPDSGILDRHGNPLPFLPGAYRDHPAELVAGVCCIGQKIEKDLFDLVLHRQDLRQMLGIAPVLRKSVCS